MRRAAVDALRKALADKQADVGTQGEAVRALEASGAPGPQIDAAVAALNDLKIDEAVIERQLQVAVSDAGLYDYGPSGGDLRSNVLAFWRQHFVDEAQMWDVECPYAPPAILFKAAGLVDDPTVLMVKDEETGRWYRAHHLLEDFCSEKLQKDLNISAEKVAELKHVLATLYLLSAEELGAKIRGYGITAPGTKNAVSDPHP